MHRCFLFVDFANFFRTLIGAPAVARRVLWITVYQLILLSFHLSSQKVFRDQLISFSCNALWCLRPMCCCAWQPDFLKRKKNSQKWGEIGPKIEFLNLLEKLVRGDGGVCGQKWVWSLLYKDTKVACISRRN